MGIEYDFWDLITDVAISVRGAFCGLVCIVLHGRESLKNLKGVLAKISVNFCYQGIKEW